MLPFRKQIGWVETYGQSRRGHRVRYDNAMTNDEALISALYDAIQQTTPALNDTVTGDEYYVVLWCDESGRILDTLAVWPQHVVLDSFAIAAAPGGQPWQAIKNIVSAQQSTPRATRP
ncbi:MAG: hypothetical protein HY975_00070 [Candidatus Kerfeldbacteria bacterium]|nr:hypothetical protein [Candidatus Kerfeldbacteria bacterium]